MALFEKKQTEEEKRESAERQKQLIAQNKELEKQLTNKNQAFFHQFHKLMEGHTYRKERQPDEVDNAILTRLVEGQKNSETANQIYGTPTDLVKFVESAPTPEELAPPTFWDQVVDSGLFITALFAALAALMQLFNATATEAASAAGGAMFGPIAMIVNFFCGGIAMGILAKYQPNMNAPKGQRGIPKYLLVSFAAVAIWLFILTMVVAIVPERWNPLLPTFLYLVIAVLAFIGRHYFRKSKNFVSL
ncbi:DUF1129 domain-containing protein [Aerococcus vaginalis]